MSGHPELEAGVTGMLGRVGQTRDQCGLPSAPKRNKSRAFASSANSGARWCSSSTTDGPYLRASSTWICPAGSVTRLPGLSGREVGDGVVTRRMFT